MTSALAAVRLKATTKRRTRHSLLLLLLLAVIKLSEMDIKIWESNRERENWTGGKGGPHDSAATHTFLLVTLLIELNGLNMKLHTYEIIYRCEMSETHRRAPVVGVEARQKSYYCNFWTLFPAIFDPREREKEKRGKLHEENWQPRRTLSYNWFLLLCSSARLLCSVVG